MPGKRPGLIMYPDFELIMIDKIQSAKEDVTVAFVKFAGLFFLCIWAFWPELTGMVSGTLNSSEKVHLLTVPVMAGLLIYLRRDALRMNLTSGSFAGIIIIIFGFFVYAFATWPFNYGYVRDVAIIPVLGGIILASCGWRVFRLSLPILLLMLLAIPIPSRIYAAIIIRFETVTIEACARILSFLPGTDVFVKGVDIVFSSAKNNGMVAMGESNRGARLLSAFGVLGTFIVFSEIRPWRRIFIVSILALPIVFLCNFLRLLFWAILGIYAQLSVISKLPRTVSFIFSILVLYGLFALVCVFKLNLFVEDDSADTKEQFSGDHE